MTFRVVMRPQTEACQHAKHFLIAHNVYGLRQFWTITYGPWLQTLGVPIQSEITVAFSAVFTGLSQLCARDKKSHNEKQRNVYL